MVNAGDLVIEPGDVELLSVDLIHSMRNVVVYEADLGSKHIEFSQGGSGDRAIIRLHAPESGSPTVLRFPPGTQSWVLVAEIAKYSLRAVLYEPRWSVHARRQLWCPRRGNV